MANNFAQQLQARFHGAPESDSPSSTLAEAEDLTAVLAALSGLPQADIHPESTWEELGLDSLDRIELAVRLEQRWSLRPEELVPAPEQLWTQLSTVAELQAALSRALKP